MLWGLMVVREHGAIFHWALRHYELAEVFLIFDRPNRGIETGR